jgi:hypothetical protein
VVSLLLFTAEVAEFIFFLLCTERAESKKQTAFGKHDTDNKPYAKASIYVGYWLNS